MKINFDQTLKDMDGKPIAENVDGKDVPLTLKAVCVRALTMAHQADSNLSGEDAFKRLELARRISQGGEQEIDPADAVTIRDRAAKIFASVIVSGQVYEMLK